MAFSGLAGIALDAFWRLECIWKSNLAIAIKVRLYKCSFMSFLIFSSSTLSNLTAFGLCSTWASVAVTMSPTSPYTVKRKPELCHLKSKSGSSFPRKLTSPRQGGSYQQILPVFTICREAKRWRAETSVFAIHLKGHYDAGGSRALTEREYDTLPKTGRLETSGCRLPGHSQLHDPQKRRDSLIG